MENFPTLYTLVFNKITRSNEYSEALVELVKFNKIEVDFLLKSNNLHAIRLAYKTKVISPKQIITHMISSRQYKKIFIDEFKLYTPYNISLICYKLELEKSIKKLIKFHITWDMILDDLNSRINDYSELVKEEIENYKNLLLHKIRLNGIDNFITEFPFKRLGEIVDKKSLKFFYHFFRSKMISNNDSGIYYKFINRIIEQDEASYHSFLKKYKY